MKEFIINENEAGQRFDKYLAKLLREAPKSVFYKMMRKKNITLNGKKATGNEKLFSGDHVKLFLSDETFEKFSGNDSAPRAHYALDIIYEDENILLINNPAGMLSQPADDGTPSLVEYLDLLGACSCTIRPNIVIHRITGDGPKSLLIAPLWTSDKRNVLNQTARYFKEHDIWQGKYTEDDKSIS